MSEKSRGRIGVGGLARRPLAAALTSGALLLLPVCANAGQERGAEKPPAEEEPSLPPGLEPAVEPDPEPELPTGLEPEAGVEEPALPTGIEPQTGAEEPTLPTGLGTPATEPGADESTVARGRLLADLHGFWEARLGPRLKDDPTQPRDYTLGESRLQLEYAHDWKGVRLEYRADLLADGNRDRLDYDQRQLRLTARLGRALDLQVGRQVLTWGTGDLVFINDLFPKDWQSFFIGRDPEYLKAPSDALRLGGFTKVLNVDLVYTPRFDPDRHLTGERLSFWSPSAGAIVGRDRQIEVGTPDSWFDDDELALRLYRSLGSVELALYGYDGFWKSPAGFDLESGRATFPRLRVIGASARGPLGPGIGNLEAGLYDSHDDPDGSDPLVANGEVRLLLGYELELGNELTGGFQYYAERLLDYGEYRRRLALGPARDELRHLLTARLTKRLLRQTLRIGLFVYWSPSDRDAYLRPEVSYRLNDEWSLGGGGNGFLGAAEHTFFAQLENNGNLYAWVRRSF